MNSPEKSVRERVSAEEWEARVNLAACYRFAAHFRMTDLIYTHISARVPGPEHHFLLNAFGLMWDEVKASNLVKITLDGEIVDDPTGLGFNQACSRAARACAKRWITCITSNGHVRRRWRRWRAAQSSSFRRRKSPRVSRAVSSAPAIRSARASGAR